MTNFKSLMNEFSNAFTRDNPRKVLALKDGSPAWMRGAIYQAHEALGGRLPDDWIYEAIRSLACNYNVYDNGDVCRDEENPICDGLVDVYTADLTAWLAGHLGNMTLCDEAVDEFEVTGDMDTRIRMGQFLAYTRISAALIEAVEAQAESLDESDEEIANV